jgi:hypothetical protein
MDLRVCLRVKVKSLAAEAKIIRKEEKRVKSQSIRESLYRHRIDVVRYEARHTNIAYGFLRGRTYAEIENKPRTAPNWDKIRRMIEKYGSHCAPWSYNVEQTLTAYETRFAEAKKHLADTLKRFDEWTKVPAA